MEDFNLIAMDFLRRTKTEFFITFDKNDFYFDDDKEKRDIYNVILRRNNREFKFKFGNSIINSGRFKVFSPNGFILCNTIEEKNKLKAKYKLGFKENKEFKIPTPYDVLACLQKYDIGSFKDFCDEFGYNIDSIKAQKIYEAVKNEYENLERLYNEDELNKLRETN